MSFGLCLAYVYPLLYRVSVCLLHVWCFQFNLKVCCACLYRSSPCSIVLLAVTESGQQQWQRCFAPMS